MNNRQLCYFLKVYECGSIKAAAEQLFISSQGLSKMIKQLEEDLNAPLFMRTANGLVPTPQGIALKPRAEKLLYEFELVAQGINDRYATKRVLTVVSTPNCLQYLTVKFLEDFRQDVPGCVLNFVEMSDFAAADKVKTDEVELGLIPAPIDTTVFQARHLFTHRLCAVINKSHPLAQKEKIDIRELDGEPVARPSRECACYRAQMNELLRRNIKPDIIFETTNFSIIPCFAQRGLGIGITLDFIAFRNPLPDTVILPFDDPGFTYTKSVYLSNRHDKRLSPEAKLFGEYLSEWIQRNKDRLFVWEQEKEWEETKTQTPLETSCP